MTKSLSDIDWSSPDDRWMFIKQREQQVQEHQIAQYRQWYLDVAFYLGFQNMFFDRNDNKVRTTNPPSWRVQSISNILLPMARAVVAQLARVEPVWRVLPATKSMDDMQIAQLSTDVLQHYWQDLRVYYKYLKALFWTTTTGNGFLKIGWDPEIGDDIPANFGDNQDGVDEFFETLFGERIAPAQQPKTIRPGDNFVDFKSPFELIFQEGAVDIDNSLYCIEATVQDVYMVQEKYGKGRTKHVNNDSDLQRSGLNYLDGISRLSGSLFRESFASTGTGFSRRDQAIVYEVHIKPHRQLKRGLKFTMSQGKDLHTVRKFPYRHKKLPYVHLPEVPVPGKLHATSTLSQSRPNQVIMNRLDSQVLEYVNLMLKGKWMVPRGAKVNEITDAPGQIIRYNHPFIPQQARLLAFPRSIFDMRDTVHRSIQDTASAHDITRGRAAGSVRSGNLAETLKESDLTVLGPTQLLHDMALADAGAMILQNTAQFVNEERLLGVTRNGRLAVSRKFIGSMLVGQARELNANYANVIVTATGRAPWSRAAQREIIGTLAQSGFLRPEVHDDVVLKSVGLENAEPIFQQADLARSKQYDESQLLNQGQEVIPNRQDSHKFHLEIMDIEEENLDFWNSLNEQSKKARNMHRAQHEKLAANQAVRGKLLLLQAEVEMMQQMGLRPVQPEGNNGNARPRNRQTASSRG